MKIFKELNKLGYKHYTEYTIEELDNLPLNSEKRTIEQSLVFRWFRQKYKFFTSIHPITISTGGKNSFRWRWAAITMTTVLDEIVDIEDESDLGFLTYEEAEQELLKELIKIIKNK